MDCITVTKVVLVGDWGLVVVVANVKAVVGRVSERVVLLVMAHEKSVPVAHCAVVLP
jgi:hypothetical protein